MNRRRSISGGSRGLLLAMLLLLAGAAPAPGGSRLQSVRTRHYLIHSDLDDALIYDLGRRMDAMYEEYSRRLSDFELRGDNRPLDVYLFDSKLAYTEFTRGRYPNTGGIFIAGQGQLAAYLEGQRDTLRHTLQHEAFHQFAAKAIGPDVPVWLNEGLAQVFEEAIWTGHGFLMAQVPPRRLRQLQSDRKNNQLIGLKRLMSLSPQQWSTNLAANPALGATQYNQSWALVHFMAYGDNGANGARLVNLLRLLWRGIEPDEAFRSAVSANLETFAAKFDRYAGELAVTAESDLIDRQRVLADLLGQLAERGRAFNDLAAFRKTVEQRQYKLQYTRGQMSWTAEPARSFRDSRGRVYEPDELFFEARGGAPLPDLVLRSPESRVWLRARFHRSGRSIESEVLVEPAATASARE